MSDGISASGTQVRSLVALPAIGPMGFVRAAWGRWKKIARAVGVVQTRILMVIFYFLIVFPLGLIMRLRGDPLHLRPSTGTNWSPHRHEPPSLDTARRQF
jgi:hypothetical protein